jgi:hypothetical protein
MGLQAFTMRPVASHRHILMSESDPSESLLNPIITAHSVIDVRDFMMNEGFQVCP